MLNRKRSHKFYLFTIILILSFVLPLYSFSKKVQASLDIENPEIVIDKITPLYNDSKWHYYKITVEYPSKLNLFLKKNDLCLYEIFSDNNFENLLVAGKLNSTIPYKDYLLGAVNKTEYYLKINTTGSYSNESGLNSFSYIKFEYSNKSIDFNKLYTFGNEDIFYIIYLNKKNIYDFNWNFKGTGFFEDQIYENIDSNHKIIENASNILYVSKNNFYDTSNETFILTPQYNGYYLFEFNGTSNSTRYLKVKEIEYDIKSPISNSYNKGSFKIDIDINQSLYEHLSYQITYFNLNKTNLNRYEGVSYFKLGDNFTLDFSNQRLTLNIYYKETLVKKTDFYLDYSILIIEGYSIILIIGIISIPILLKCIVYFKKSTVKID